MCRIPTVTAKHNHKVTKQYHKASDRIMETNNLKLEFHAKKTKNKKWHLDFKAAGKFLGLANAAVGGRPNLGLCGNSAVSQSETLI